MDIKDAAMTLMMMRAANPQELSSGQYGCVTCVGCTAKGHWSEVQAICKEFRATGICQRQVHARLTILRLFLAALPTFYENNVLTKNILDFFREMVKIIV